MVNKKFYVNERLTVQRYKDIIKGPFDLSKGLLNAKVDNTGGIPNIVESSCENSRSIFHWDSLKFFYPNGQFVFECDINYLVDDLIIDAFKLSRRFNFPVDIKSIKHLGKMHPYANTFMGLLVNNQAGDSFVVNDTFKLDIQYKIYTVTTKGMEIKAGGFSVDIGEINPSYGIAADVYSKNTEHLDIGFYYDPVANVAPTILFEELPDDIFVKDIKIIAMYTAADGDIGIDFEMIRSDDTICTFSNTVLGLIRLYDYMSKTHIFERIAEQKKFGVIKTFRSSEGFTVNFGSIEIRCSFEVLNPHSDNPHKAVLVFYIPDLIMCIYEPKLVMTSKGFTTGVELLR